MSNVVGIDLGTTFSCVACLEGGKPVVIPNLEGLSTTPSVVSFTSSGERLIGTPAMRQALTNPRNTVFSVKRLIGRKFQSPEIQRALGILPYELVENPNGDVYVSVDGKKVSPEEISSMILAYLRSCAESFLGDKVASAVITVPAHFNDQQRQATKDAAKIAGLNVLRVINEPTAASLAYGLDAKKNATVAVYDLGGGTFDITVLEINEGVFQVLSTNGDSYLGGEDFDNRIVAWIADGFKAEYGTDLCDDKLSLQRVKEAAERAKRELSFTTQTEINLPFIFSDPSSSKHIRRSLSRRELEEMTSDLVDKTIPLIQQALADAGLGLERIDEIILVGGQTRMPLVRQKITEFFGKQPVEGINPDEIVACGAAIQSGNLQNGIRDLIVLLDVTPFSLGIETEKDTFEIIIDRNSTIPIRKTKAFTTVEHNQRRVKIHVLQGENPIASLNKSLAVFELVGIEPAPAGVPQIDVTFAIDADGLVKVTAKDPATGLQQKIQVMPSGGLLSSEVDEIIRQDEARRLKEGGLG